MRIRKKTLLITAAIIIGIVFGGGLFLYLVQDKLVFFPRKYGVELAELEKHYHRLEYETERNGRQFSYYAGLEETIPEKLWILTGGNGSLALDWNMVVELALKLNPKHGYLLVEYPGYGDCEGKPSRVGIQENMEGAVYVLAAFLKTDANTVKSNSSFLGHSLGCAVALEATSEWGREEVIVVSPFTSMRDMAGLTVGGPLISLVRHQWDNQAAIKAISKRDKGNVTIFHGIADRVIPVTMSEELAAPFPESVTLIRKKGLGHNDIVYVLRDELARRMAKPRN